MKNHTYSRSLLHQSQRENRKQLQLFWILQFFLIPLFVGCEKPDGPTRYHISGKVTFNGQPVRMGTISFDPDTSKGNTGPSGYAVVKDGKYDTQQASGKGTIGGFHIVTINGFDEILVPDKEGGEGEIVARKALFEGYRTVIELKKETGSVDFNIPSSDASSVQ